MNVEQIVATWGEGFRELAGNPRVRFAEDHIEVDLKSAIKTLEGVESKVLTITEPTTRDLKAMDSATGDVAKAAALLSMVAGVTAGEVDKIKASDFSLLQQVIGGFLA
jgi:hypothetical protein